MIFAIMIMFVASLLVAGVVVAASGDITLTRHNTSQKEAYNAALAGIEVYQYHLSTEPNYWNTCPKLGPEKEVPGDSEETYTVTTLPSSTGSGTCESGNQTSIIEGADSASGTFRIESTGTSGTGANKATRSIVATFTHPGFTAYVYFTNYEVLDPSLLGLKPEVCEHFYNYRSLNSYKGENPSTKKIETKKLTEWCPPIEFAPGDEVNGPFHTNDAAAVCGSPVFGRAGEEPPDAIQMNGGHYPYSSGCANSPTINGKYTEIASDLPPPSTDNELATVAGKTYSGKTIIELESTQMTVTNNKGEKLPPENFPSNGVIYVSNSPGGACSAGYSPYNTSYTTETECGTVSVKGTYSKSLTIAAEGNIIINGNLTTTAKTSGEPTGGAVLGLIANEFVRIYHPVKKEYEVAHENAITTTPTPFFKEETPRTREGKPLEQAPTTKENTKEEAGTGSKHETCKSGFTYSNTTKMCVGKVTEESCPVGYTLANKKCTEKVTEEYCNTGYNLTNKKCVATSSEEKCSNGYTLNGKNQCVKSCPTNPKETYVESEGICLGECEGNDKSVGKNSCEYVNSSSACDAPNETGSRIQ